MEQQLSVDSTNRSDDPDDTPIGDDEYVDTSDIEEGNDEVDIDDILAEIDKEVVITDFNEVIAREEARLKEQLDAGEITQEDYDKLIEMLHEPSAYTNAGTTGAPLPDSGPATEELQFAETQTWDEWVDQQEHNPDWDNVIIH